MTRRYWNINLEEIIEARVHFGREAYDLVSNAASRGKQFLIVGTKKKAADLVVRALIRAQYHYVNKMWLRDMLTNWSTTEERFQKFRDFRIEQKMGRLAYLLKRDEAMLKRQLPHLQTYLGGIKYMTELPDIIIIIDQQKNIRPFENVLLWEFQRFV
ncbi:hypothetical protein Cgig2_024593 [Carnegiea gigantea]|uniref:Small ribosomal subunit protein uS2c n=1 Tax=Carnegiea gigantea TaxID=171969 RepID=A0A9Q1QJ84_9CARY|nr:hypothetical protein Cgig2_024593 [Carnegiea gigantea]